MVVNVHDENIKLADLVLAVKNGEEVFIVTDSKKIYKIVEVEITRPHPQYGSAEGLFEMADDFDEPLEEFKEYT